MAWIDYRYEATVSIAADERWREVPAVNVDGVSYRVRVQVTIGDDRRPEVRNYFAYKRDGGKEASAALRKKLRPIWVSLAETILEEHAEHLRDLRERALLIRLDECHAELDELGRKRQQLLDRQAALQAELLATVGRRPAPQAIEPHPAAPDPALRLLPPQLSLF